MYTILFCSLLLVSMFLIAHDTMMQHDAIFLAHRNAREGYAVNHSGDIFY